MKNPFLSDLSQEKAEKAAKEMQESILGNVSEKAIEVAPQEAEEQVKKISEEDFVTQGTEDNIEVNEDKLVDEIAPEDDLVITEEKAEEEPEQIKELDPKTAARMAAEFEAALMQTKQAAPVVEDKTKPEISPKNNEEVLDLKVKKQKTEHVSDLGGEAEAEFSLDLPKKSAAISEAEISSKVDLNDQQDDSDIKEDSSEDTLRLALESALLASVTSGDKTSASASSSKEDKVVEVSKKMEKASKEKIVVNNEIKQEIKSKKGRVFDLGQKKKPDPEKPVSAAKVKNKTMENKNTLRMDPRINGTANLIKFNDVSKVFYVPENIA
jgi:hypothetical protein